MADYIKKAVEVARKIKEKGQAVTWVKRAAVVIADETKPWLKTPDEDGPNEYPVYILFLTLNRVNYESKHYDSQNTDMVSTSLRGYMAGNVGFVPSPQDTVLRDGVTLRVVNVDTLAPNGQAILHTIEFE